METPTHKELKTHHFHPYKKKDAQSENQELFWDTSDNGGWRANHHPKRNHHATSGETGEYKGSQPRSAYLSKSPCSHTVVRTCRW